MGFNAPQARQALKETGGDVERAVDWLFSHPEAQGDFEDDTAPAVDNGLKELPGTSDLPSQFQLSSIICHKGSSVHTG
jgi:ubiquitin carboxyl-terminal hydrolase 5/13